MLDLALRPTTINGHRYKNDYIVVWRSDFGERRVGRIRLAESASVGVWVYHLHADLPVPPWGSGRCRQPQGGAGEISQGVRAVLR